VSLVAILILAAALVAGVATWWRSRSASRDTGALRRPRGGLPDRPGGREAVAEREALEAEDLAQLLEVHNARRRVRGEPERSVQDVETMIAAERTERRTPRDALGSKPGP
jgi:hypothetical protein